MVMMSASFDHPRKHSISVEEYLRMDEAGVFAPEARLELIEGEIIEMAPIKPPHAARVAQLTERFVLLAADQATVWTQGPLVISGRSVPQPDIALLRRRPDFYGHALPTVADVLLVVEVSDSTLAYDLRTKAPLYGRSGISEVWVVDVNARSIHAFRDLVEGAYRTVIVATGAQRVSCEALPQVSIEVAELFPD